MAFLRELVVRFTEDPQWLPAITDEVIAGILDELPELADDEELRAATAASTAAVMRLFVDMLRSGLEPGEAEPPPAAVELARELVRRGVSIEALLRAYHTGQAGFFGAWTRQLRERLDSVAEVAQAVEETTTWSFAYVQALTRGLAQRYAEESERWVRSAAAMRAETVRELLAGAPLGADVAGRRLRYELDRRHVAFVVWSEGSDQDLAVLEQGASDVAESLGAGTPLLVPFGPALVAGWIGAVDAVDERALAGVRVASAPGARAAVGRPDAGVEGFRQSHVEAMHARRVAQLSGRRAGTVVAYRDVALAALASTDLDHARQFVAAELGPLAADDDHTLRLAATLRVYLEEQSSPRRAAERLGVHENTIANRIRAAQELLEEPIEARVPELLVALRLAPLVQPPLR